MKRTALTSLMLIYLLSCFGVGVNRFYCCGKLASVKLVYNTSENELQKHDVNNCCKNELKSFKIKDTHVGSGSFSLSELMPVLLPSFFGFDQVTVAKASAVSLSFRDISPPKHPDIPIYTLHCNYRI